MNTYKVCIEKWSGAKPEGEGFRFMNYRSRDKDIAGYRNAKKFARLVVKNNPPNTHCVVILRGPLPSLKGQIIDA